MVYKENNNGDDLIVAEPNRSAEWETNKLLLIVMCCVSGGIALAFSLILGAWPILPFAGLEMLALGSALYYVSWKLRYRHVITLGAETVRIQKGHYYPRKQWEIKVDEAALSITPERHPWDAPAITLFSKGEEISLGEFLNREDALKLLSHLKGRLRIGNHSPRSKQEF
ncbi:MAG: DUF2244 domain-containing protein [Halieaceae bacterium]|nr:DUF2244 domain-containing protein [Halieaceae bacterium]